jgi:phenylalanyl-tRNA synthetase beta chain
MKISTGALKFINQHYGSAGDPAADGIDDLVARIGAQLGAVEEVIPFGERFQGVLVVRIVSCEDHPQADRLHVCKIDDGGRAENVERDENGHVQVVCGAPNAREGLLVAWLPPGATVPNTYSTPDPFVLESRALRGVISYGMLASPKELSFGDSHDGILEIDGDIAPGTAFAESQHLDGDVIIDMENKMFTHRPDCFGWLGIAREIEGIYHRPYKSPEWYRMDAEIPEPEAEMMLPFTFHNELPELVPRFTAIVMRDVTVKTSPVWLQADLARVGLRPINNIVDYTNFFMIETGQPLHAYDYDKVKALSGGEGAVITVRHPREGEKITLLNGKEIEPRAEAVMIATDKTLIGIGGVMGGADTEVDENTKNIILECANFDMYSIRRTSMAHGLFTDAVTRFNKGQSPLQNRAVLAKVVDEIRRFADGKVASPLTDDNHLSEEVITRGNLHAPVTVTSGFINARLGFDLSAEDMAGLLRNVEFRVDVQDDAMTISAPFWRTDIAQPEDIVEEVGRLYGYDHLPLVLPRRDLTPAPRDAGIELKMAISRALAKAGASETLNYSFVHGDLLAKVGQDTAKAFRISNALSPDLQYYRLSLTPSLLDKVHANSKAGHGEFALFEVNKVHAKDIRDEDGLPKELSRVALVFAADDKTAKAQYAGAPYYQARKYLLNLLTALGVEAAGELVFEPLDPADPDPSTAYYQPGRSATIKLGEVTLGRIGEYASSVRRALKLPAFTAGFELGLAPLAAHLKQTGSSYVQLPRFPAVEQDICLRVPADMPYAQVFSFVWGHIDANRPEQTYHSLGPVDIYQREGDPAHKQITLRLRIASYERTLTDTEVNALLDGVAAAAAETVGAERV